MRRIRDDASNQKLFLVYVRFRPISEHMDVRK